ncbi:endonuclease [Sporosarcina sp.]|uniref:endonuclease n=1 Tax=Sporosarcina sp. TaxID=49982 RepID=UPI002610014A|nr:endonuclease [Sporosarcina sp.]
MEGYKIFYSRICGKLLGDGCITKQAGRKPRFQFIHRIEDLGWSAYCYEQLKDFVPLSTPAYRKCIDARLTKGFSECYVVQSRTHERITDLYQTWYPDGKKRVPFHFLNEYLTEEALSWWYQDDGHLKIVNGKMTKVILSTESFSAEENRQLITLLFHKFRLQFKTDGQNRLILYDQFQIIYFLQLTSLWMHDAMYRKAAVELPLRTIAKRTTVYLPASIKFFKPTAEINEKLDKLNALFCAEKKTVCQVTIFNIFQQVSIVAVDTVAYQIVLSEAHREVLAMIRQQTGLSVSQLVTYCFEKSQ